MKRRLISLLLIACMLFSIIPVSAAGETVSGTLTLGQLEDVVALAPGETRLYTFEAQGNTRYYYYLAPQAGSTDWNDFFDVEIRPEGTHESGHGTSYHYHEHSQGTIFVSGASDTVRIFLYNRGDTARTFRVGVEEQLTTATTMELDKTTVPMELGSMDFLRTLFLPAVTFDENVSFVVDNPGVVELSDYLAGVNLEAVGIGTATVTATWGSVTQTATVTVTAPNAADITSAPATVTPKTHEENRFFFSFVAPADAAGNYYVVSMPNREDARMDPIGFQTDNFVDPTGELVLYEGSALTPGETYYVRVIADGGSADPITVTFEKSVIPASFSLDGNTRVAQGETASLWPVFAATGEHIPVTWSVDDPSILELDAYGNYSADFIAKADGIATVTATIVGTNISASVQVEVGQHSGGSGGRETFLLEGNDGTFTITEGSESFTDVGYMPLELGVGECLSDYGITITDVAFWTPRAFLGWEVFRQVEVVDPDGNVYHNEIPTGELLTTQELLDYVLPADTVLVFRALWDGNDSDYYFHLDFDTLGGEMTIGNSDYSESSNAFGSRIRRDNAATLEDSLGWTITADPTHPDPAMGAFEGWLMYQEDGNGNMVRVSATPVTSADIFSAAPVNCNVFYVTKWAGIPMSDYDNLNPGGTGNPNEPVPVAPIDRIEEITWIQGNSNGDVFIEFTPDTTGLYMLGHHVEWGEVSIDEDASGIYKVYDHDLMFLGSMFCGPVYQLTAGTTYAFAVHMDVPDMPFLMISRPEATDIYPIETEYTGYVGHYIELYYQVSPQGSFTGVNTSVSSDPTVADDAGGANWDCSRVIELYKKGSADITVTLANGKSITVKVNAIDPPALTPGTAETVTLDAQKTTVWSFTAPAAGMYYVTATSTAGECILAEENHFIGSFYEGTTNGIWLNMRSGDTTIITLANPSNKADTYTVTANACPAPTGLSLENVTLFPTQYWVLRPNFEPLGAYDTVTGWTVSDPDVLYLEDYLMEAGIQALKPGTVTVTVTTASGATATGTVTVREPMKLDAPETVTLVPGEFKDLIFEAPADGYYFISTPTNDNVVMYLSANNDSMYTENVNGYWTELLEGDYLYIYLENRGDKTVSSTVTVTDALAPITEITVEDITIYEGLCGTVEFHVTPFGAATLESVVIADETIATIDYAYGYCAEVKGLKAGTTTMTLTAESGVKAVCNITVKAQSPIVLDQPVQVDLTKPNDMVCYTFTAPEDGAYMINSTGLFTYGIILDDIVGFDGKYNQPAFYLSKDMAISVLLYTGEVAASGTVTITKLETATAFSVPDAVSGITGSTEILMITTTPANTAHGYYVEWTVDDESVAVISNDGYNGVQLELLKSGTTKLNLYLDGELYKSIPVTVSDPITIPADTSKPATVAPEAVDSALQDAIANAQPGENAEVVIDVEEVATAAGTTVTSVELPVASLEAIVDAEATVTVQLSGATVVMDSQTLAAIVQQADGATVTLSVETVDEETLSEAQQKALENKKVGAVITALVLSNGEPIGDFKGGSVSVSVPFTPPEGKSGNSYAVWYVADDGTMEKMKTSYAGGVLTFTTKHFSDYVALEEESAPAPTDPAPTDPAPTDPAPTDPAPTDPAPTDPAPSAPSTGTNPPTGDTVMLTMLMLVFAAAMLLALTVGKKRRA